MKIKNSLQDCYTQDIHFDCENLALGRMATQVAVLLMGKNLPEWRPNIDFPITVHLVNWQKIYFSGHKMKQKMYHRHSGYIGSIKSQTLEELWQKDPQAVIISAIKGMLPKNKLQAQKIKRLKFEQGTKNE